MDLMQKAIRDGRLKFGDRLKSQMRIDSDALQVADAHLTEPSFVNMVKVSVDYAEKAIMVEATEGFNQGVTEGFNQGITGGFNKGTTEGFIQGVTKGSNKGITEGFIQIITTNETIEGFIQINNITEATEGLRIKLRDLDINEDANLAINMVEVTQETAMEVYEQSLR